MEKFYTCQPGNSRGEVILKLPGSYDDEALFLGELNPGKLMTKVKSGKNFFDIVTYYDSPLNFAVSQKVITVLQEAGLTGWKTYDIDIKDHAEKKYFGFQVIGKCGKMADEEEGEVTGYSFDHQTWDGADLFCPSGTLLIFCTKKLKNAFDAAKISNLDFVPIEEVVWYSFGESDD